jgi:signal transduction histidine kinase/CheY-like chemotaxis protein
MVEWDAEGEPLLMVGTVQDVTETARALEELERSRHQLDLHNRIIRTFLTESGAALYAGVLDIVRDMLDSPLGYFGYIDHEGSLVSESMTQDIWDRCQIPDKAVVFRRDCWSGIWGDSLQRKVTRVSNGPFHTPQGHLPLHCAIAVPIIYHGELVGQVVLANKPGGYAEYDRERLEGIADLVAPILKSRLEAERHEREREQLHAQLQLRRRLEALGTLAGGIAHDFNNMLGAILGHAEMAAERLPEDSEEHDHLARVGAAAERAAQLVAKILAFSQQAEGEARPTRIEAVITETIELLKPAVPRHVHVSVQASGDLPAVLVDPSQLHQVILNLCTNALYAMREKGGALRIGAETAHLTEADGERLGVPAPGEYVRMSVADTGTGIPEEIRDRVFDPFFSSKPVGEGTGMGLSTAHGIIASHGGAIALESELGEGTTFHVYLPTTTERPIEEQVAREQAGSRPARILLVDDEASMVEVAQQLLSVLGYEVECFTDPARALDALGTDPAGFDIVLTDLTMPDISGMDVAETAKGLNAGIHVVLMTGFSVSSYLDVSENPVVDGFLQKPFGKRKLAEVLAALGQ